MELLAPAGGIGTALAAFDAGADAVYMGLSKFNARERTENFSADDLSKLLAYAHKIGRKVHVALNTLIKEAELPEVMETLELLSALRPDAVIVQDLGVVRLLRQYYPELTVHGSTQMGIHNTAGIRIAENLGLSRVILERQTTLEELKIMRKSTKMEIEVFGHGALCCSLSGGCFFSSFLGGASGNRGKCKQPCRRFYSAQTQEGYLFSPGDLNMLTLVPELKKIGVDSLKIEGRMKKADYVQSVVSAYRMVLDAPQLTPEILAEAAYQLQRTAGRNASTGFADVKNFSRLIVPEQPGVWGFPIGKITAVNRESFTVKLSKKLHRGDRIRLLTQFEEDGPALIAGNLQVNGNAVNAAKAGELCVIFSNTAEAVKNAQVYKIGECPRDYSARAAALPLQRIPLDLKITIDADMAAVEVLKPAGLKPFYYGLELTAAEKRGVTAEDLLNVFRQTNSEVYELGQAEININGNLFFPASLQKSFRRDFFARAEADYPQLNPASGQALYKFYQEYKSLTPPDEYTEATELVTDEAQVKNAAAHIAVPVALYRADSRADEVILPQFCAEKQLDALRKQLDFAYLDGVRRYRVCGLYGLTLLKKYNDITMIAASPLPGCNSMAAKMLKELNVNVLQLWPEFAKVDAMALQKVSPLPLEQLVYGAVELLQSRALLPGNGRIADRRNNAFQIIHDPNDKLHKICTAKALQLELLPGCGAVYDRRYEMDGEITSFNWNQAWL